MRIFYFFVLLWGIIFFSSCGSDDDSTDAATSITISMDTTLAEAGGTFTFMVKTNKGDNVTSSSTITVDNTVLEGNTFTTEETGTYTVKASYNNLVSTNHYEVVVIDRMPSSIELSADKTSLYTGEISTFTVITDQGTDVTYQAVIEANDVPLEREKFIPEKPGIYTVTATYAGISSPPLEVEVIPHYIALSADTPIASPGEAFTFSVTADDDEIDITENAVILIDGEPIEGHIFEPNEAGLYIVTAVFMEEYISEPIRVIATGEEGNSFTVDGTPYETPTGSFAYFGTFTGPNGLETIWAFNPFLEIDNDDGTLGYPNDAYIYFAIDQTDPDNLIFPSDGTYIYDAGTLPEIIDAQVYYDDTPWVGAGDTFENITLIISGISEWEEGTSSVQQIAYAITKSDSTVVTGQYSGSLFAWNASGRTPRKEKKPAGPATILKPGTFSGTR